jgi:hypothetical protein
MAKSILLKNIFIDIVMYNTSNSFQKIYNISVKKPKISKQIFYKNMSIEWTSFLVFDRFDWSNFEGCSSLSKIFNLTSGETSVKSTHACFAPTQSQIRTSAVLKVDLPSRGLVYKFTYTSFFTYTHVRLKMSQRTSLTKSCLYLKSESFLQ